MKPITQYSFPNNQYIKTETKKTQIYLHHTAGSANPFGAFNWWASNPERVGACVAIGGNPGSKGKWQDGQIVQGFSSKYWAYHLGLKEKTFDSVGLPYKSLDKISIAIEICNYGPLRLNGEGQFVNWANGIVNHNEVCELSNPFKEVKYYHAYTDEQLDSVYQLLKFWEDRYDIPVSYQPDIFGISTRALSGEPGLYTHNSVRRDKNDVSPQPKMIEMLKSL